MSQERTLIKAKCKKAASDNLSLAAFLLITLNLKQTSVYHCGHEYYVCRDWQDLHYFSVLR